MPPLRFVWLVERGWIASQVERLLLAQVSPAAFERRDARREKGTAEIALDSRAGPAWIVPETDQVQRVVDVARPLFEAQSLLPRAHELGVPSGLIDAVGAVYLHYEELWDRILSERLESEQVAGMAREGLDLVRSRKEKLSLRHKELMEPIEQQYMHVLEQVAKGLEPIDLRLGVSRSPFVVPRPFSGKVLGVSSLESLRSLLPPFTEGLGPHDWELFRDGQKLLEELTNAIAQPPPLDVARRLANRLLAESTTGATQVVTPFDWELQRIVATAQRPVWECVQLFENAADKPAKWFTSSRVRVIGGLLGLAYFDVLVPKGPHCPDCGVPTEPGRRGPRNVRCDRCRRVRRQKSQAEKGSFHKSQSPQFS